jgi:hypothetical protein
MVSQGEGWWEVKGVEWEALGEKGTAHYKKPLNPSRILDDRFREHH